MLHLVCKPPALISLWVACWNLFSMCIRYRFGLLLSSALNFIVHVFIFLACWKRRLIHFFPVKKRFIMFRVYVVVLPPKLRSLGALLLVCWRKRLDLYFPLFKQKLGLASSLFLSERL